MVRSPRRAFEHQIGPLRGARTAMAGRGVIPRRFSFERLMYVSFHHQYYNRSDDECRDFVVLPTHDTSSLMRSLGLLFKEEQAGFSVFYDTRRAGIIEDYLRRQANDQGEIWTRLSFALALRNPYFVNFTAVPIDTNPTRVNFYFSNREAHSPGPDGVVLNPGEHVTRKSLLTVEPVERPVEVPEGFAEVEVRDISGEVVLCKPRCVPEELLKVLPPERIDCDAVRHYDGGGPVRCTNVLYVEFSLLPEGRYNIELVGRDGREPVGDGLYTISSPLPLCFIDLLFTAPDGSPLKEFRYPVRKLSGVAEIVPVHYRLVFAERKTIWTYYIMPQFRRERLEDLRIVEHDAQDPVGFDGPHPVVLPDGTEAYRFDSERCIELFEQSPRRFQLLGRRASMVGSEPLVNRLPVASALQVLPRHLKKLPRRGVLRDQASTARSSARHPESCPECTHGSIRNYSDIYVTV